MRGHPRSRDHAWREVGGGGEGGGEGGGGRENDAGNEAGGVETQERARLLQATCGKIARFLELPSGVSSFRRFDS
jgi:hypothetical protein